MTVVDDLSTLLPSAKAMMEKIALAEAEKASDEMRRSARRGGEEGFDRKIDQAFRVVG
jgi:hypothetical protein